LPGGGQNNPARRKNLRKMENEPPEKRKQNYMLRRSILDYGMGIIIFGFGIFLLISSKLGYKFWFDDVTRYIFAGLFLVYGTWRFYRGYQKNYFN
jgi:hypothetical protein